MRAPVYLTGLSEIRVGGSYYRFRRMVQALTAQGMSVHVITTSAIWDEIDDTNIRWHRICSSVPLFLRPYAFFILFPFCCFYWVITERIQKVIVFGPVYAALLFLLKILPRRRIFCMVRGMLSREMAYQKRNFAIIKGIVLLELLGFKVSDRIVVVSKTLAKSVRRRYGQRDEKIFYLPNEIPTINSSGPVTITFRSSSLENHTLKIFTGGVITRGKYFESLLHAAANLEIPCHITIAGKPAQKDDRIYFKFLNKIVEDSGIKQHVSWVGWLDKEALVKALCGSDLFISTSHHEGMSNILLQALAANVPCFAKNSPESVELLKSKVLVFDSSDDLAKMITRFYQKGDFYTQVRDLCRKAKKAWSFNWEEQLLKVLSWKEVL